MRVKNVLLINPPPWFDPKEQRFVNTVREVDCAGRQEGYVIQPTSFVFLAPLLLKEGFNVKIKDANVFKTPYQKLKEELKRESFEVVIFLANLDTLDYDLKTAKIVKEINKNALTLAFGSTLIPYASFILKKYKDVDALIYNEPEETVRVFLKNLQRWSKEEALQKTAGLWFINKTNELQKNPPTPIRKNLDSLPLGAWHLFPMEKYSVVYQRDKPIAALRTSFGCAFRCSFCLVGGWSKNYPDINYGLGWRAFSALRVLAEIDYLVKNFKVREIFFIEDSFTLSRERVLAICQGLIERKYPLVWRCLSRVDAVDQEMLKMMYKAGCRNICFGCESASQEILDNVEKNIKVEQIKKALHLTKEAGIAGTSFWVLGLPGETKETALKTIEFARKTDALAFEWTLATPYPGTKFYDFCQKRKYLKFKNLNNLDQTTASIEYPSLSQKDLKNLHYLALRRTTLSFEKIKKRLFWGIRQFLKTGNFGELVCLFKTGLTVLKSYLKGARFIR